MTVYIYSIDDVTVLVEQNNVLLHEPRNNSRNHNEDI